MSWQRVGERIWMTSDPIEVQEVRDAVAVDKADCPSCVGQYDGVLHCSTYIVAGTARTHHCRSLSRWFNPKTRTMEGTAHCTCDTCY